MKSRKSQSEMIHVADISLRSASNGWIAEADIKSFRTRSSSIAMEVGTRKKMEFIGKDVDEVFSHVRQAFCKMKARK